MRAGAVGQAIEIVVCSSCAHQCTGLLHPKVDPFFRDALRVASPQHRGRAFSPPQVIIRIAFTAALPVIIGEVRARFITSPAYLLVAKTTNTGSYSSISLRMVRSARSFWAESRMPSGLPSRLPIFATLLQMMLHESGLGNSAAKRPNRVKNAFPFPTCSHNFTVSGQSALDSFVRRFAKLSLVLCKIPVFFGRLSHHQNPIAARLRAGCREERGRYLVRHPFVEHRMKSDPLAPEFQQRATRPSKILSHDPLPGLPLPHGVGRVGPLPGNRGGLTAL